MIEQLWKLSMGAVLALTIWLVFIAAMLEVLACQEKERLRKPIANVKVER